MKLKNLYSAQNFPLFKVLIQTMLLFVVILLPLSINFASSPPPYSIVNKGPDGMSFVDALLYHDGYNISRTLVSTDPIMDLNSTSTLVIAGGTKTYRNSERILIDSFVLRGGTLVLLGGDGVVAGLAGYFGIIYSGLSLFETVHYYKSPEIILVNSTEINDTLCFVKPKAILEVASDKNQREIGNIITAGTTFIDSNGDGIWSVRNERTQNYKIGTVIRRGRGVIIAITSSSFLVNELYTKLYGNINLIRYYLSILSSEKPSLICFEESHKRWPLGSTEGIINQSYGNLILLSKSQLLIFIIVLLISILYYFVPRIQTLFKPTESYRNFLSKRIWSRGRELYDTFGQAVKPTVEEKILFSLYFQYELHPQAFNLYLQQKLSYIKPLLLTKEEKEMFEVTLIRKIDYDTFIYLFSKLEEIQKRKRLM